LSFLLHCRAKPNIATDKLHNCSIVEQSQTCNRQITHRFQPANFISQYFELPDKQETYRFWNNIWGTPKIHNAVEWTQKEYFDVPTEQAQKITKEDIKKK